MTKKRSIILLLVAALLIPLVMTGCSKDKETPTPTTNKTIKKQVTLYFGDDQAEYVVAEKRTVEVKGSVTDEKLGTAIINALIAGPKTEGLQPTLPKETRLLSLKIKDSIAYVDFSQEMVSKHWGGSAGETMTISSVVNSLTELKGIKKVQFMVAGKKQDSLLGHWDTSSPIARSSDIIKQ